MCSSDLANPCSRFDPLRGHSRGGSFDHPATSGVFPSRTDRLLCCLALDGESDFLKDRWLPGTWGSIRERRIRPISPIATSRKSAPRSSATVSLRRATSANIDGDGHAFLCDRKRDMVISGGVNIYPTEIEAVLHAVPGVHDCAVRRDARNGRPPVSNTK